MKIAYVVPYVPNQIRTRSYNLISHLSKSGHEVVVLTLASNKGDFVDAESLRTRCKEVYYYRHSTWQSVVNCVLALPSNKPLQSVYSWNPRLAEKLRSLVGSNKGKSDVDVVHVEHLRGSRYGVFLKSIFPTIPVVWDSVDCISHLFEQAAKQSGSSFGKIITKLELGRTRKAEGELVGDFDRVLVTSATDKNALMDLALNGKNAAPISVLPNGADLIYFQPNETMQRDSETIVFSGKMSYHANISMVKYLVADIMPRIWKHRPGARLIVVGKDPPFDVRNLAQNPLVTVTGTVADIRPFLWRATVAVVPLVYGAGIQNKILEAMATGTPVVATSKAVSALLAVAGREILIADTPGEFAARVLELITDWDLRKEIGQNGLQYVQKHHDWTAVTRQLVGEYQAAILSSLPVS